MNWLLLTRILLFIILALISFSSRLRTSLAFGSDFGLPIYKINYFQHFLKFESIFGRLRKLEHSTATIDEY